MSHFGCDCNRCYAAARRGKGKKIDGCTATLALYRVHCAIRHNQPFNARYYARVLVQLTVREHDHQA